MPDIYGLRNDRRFSGWLDIQVVDNHHVLKCKRCSKVFPDKNQWNTSFLLRHANGKAHIRNMKTNARDRFFSGGGEVVRIVEENELDMKVSCSKCVVRSCS